MSYKKRIDEKRTGEKRLVAEDFPEIPATKCTHMLYASELYPPPATFVAGTAPRAREFLVCSQRGPRSLRVNGQYAFAEHIKTSGISLPIWYAHREKPRGERYGKRADVMTSR